MIAVATPVFVLSLPFIMLAYHSIFACVPAPVGCVLYGCSPTRSAHSAPACSHACLQCTVGCACLAVTTGQRLASSSAWRRYPSPPSRTSSARRWMASRPFGRSGCRYAGGVLGTTVRLSGRPRHLFRQSNEQRTMCGCVDDNNQVYVVGRMADQVRPTSAVQCHAVHASLQRSPLTVRLSLCCDRKCCGVSGVGCGCGSGLGFGSRCYPWRSSCCPASSPWCPTACPTPSWARTQHCWPSPCPTPPA